MNTENNNNEGENQQPGGLDIVLGYNQNQDQNIDNKEGNAGEKEPKGGEGTENQSIETKEVDYSQYESETYGVSGDELKSLIETGRKFSEENARIVKDESKFAVLDLLDKGLDFDTIKLIQETGSETLSDIDKVIISKKLEGDSLSRKELQSIIENEYKLYKNDEGEYDKEDPDTEIGLIKLKRDAAKAIESINKYKENLNNKFDPKEELEKIVTSKVAQWNDKLPGIIKDSSTITFGNKEGKDVFSYPIPAEEQYRLAESANDVIKAWATNGTDGSPEQLREILQMDYLYANRDKIFAAMEQSVSSKKELEHHNEIHNPNGLESDTQKEKEIKGGLDLILNS